MIKETFLTLFFSVSVFCQENLYHLKGKKIYFYGDSITYGLNSSNNQYSVLVSKSYGAIMVNKGVSGTTMIYNMKSEIIPIFNPNTDGLIFVSFLTNDVGYNLHYYSLKKFGNAIDIVVNNILKAGWPKDRIKFNTRYFITEKGLNYVGYAGVRISADFIRYNAFADLLKSKLNGYGIQYFDHWNSLSVIPHPTKHLDSFGRHPDKLMHKIIADNIVQGLKLKFRI